MNQTIRSRIEQIKRGEIPEGYEKTPFGIFPCDWEKEKSFKELFSFFGGLGKSREELGTNGVCYLHYGDMHTGNFTKVSYAQYFDKPKYEIKISGEESFLMNDGDIAFLDASEDLEGTSRAVLIDNPENRPFIAGLHTILAKEKQKVLSKNYKQYISMPQYVRKQFQRLAVGFKVYGLNRETFNKVKISFPKSKVEQEKIAEILQEQDRLIEFKEKLIEEKKKQKQYLMEALLTGKVRLPGFTDEWVVIPLGQVSDMSSGGTPLTSKQEYFGNDHIWVSIADMSSSGKYIFDSKIKLSNLGLNNCSARLFKKGTVLFAMYASIGECVIAGEECCTSQAILGIVPNTEKLNNEFLYYSLIQKKTSIIAMQQASSQPNLNKGLVQSIQIELPPRLEQIAIVNVLSKADDELDLLQKELEEQKRKKQSLMQLLLTGIVRVKA